jgi:hypothetical protein
VLSVFPPNNIFAFIFVAAGTCIPRRCIAVILSSDSTIPAFKLSLQSKVVGRDMLVSSNIQYVMKGKQANSSSQNFLFLFDSNL